MPDTAIRVIPWIVLGLTGTLTGCPWVEVPVGTTDGGTAPALDAGSLGTEDTYPGSSGDVVVPCDPDGNCPGSENPDGSSGDVVVPCDPDGNCPGSVDPSSD